MSAPGRDTDIGFCLTMINRFAKLVFYMDVLSLCAWAVQLMRALKYTLQPYFLASMVYFTLFLIYL